MKILFEIKVPELDKNLFQKELLEHLDSFGEWYEKCKVKNVIKSFQDENH